VVRNVPSGVYFGGHIGGDWGHSRFSDPTGVFSTVTAGAKPIGSLGGMQLGYDWHRSAFVFGLQSDISLIGANTSSTASLSPTLLVSTNTKWISTLTGRAGYAWDGMLWYAKGGQAWVRNDYAALASAPPLNATASVTHTGYVVGSGLEFALGPRWSGFLEYDYINLANKFVNLRDPVNGTLLLNIPQNLQMVKVGLIFRPPAWSNLVWPR
jgi:outer membrane immunogenic protein